jgi:hypothetical protein
VQTIPNEFIESLAKADVTKESIETIKEIFISYEVLDNGLFTWSTEECYCPLIPKPKLKGKMQKWLGRKMEETLFGFF